jgi:ubiquinone/menaquinone biosynthesis C-methylase UbiE
MIKKYRNKIYLKFIKHIPFNSRTKFIDIGTTNVDLDHENYIVKKYPYKKSVTCLSNQNLSLIRKEFPEIKTIKGDGRKIKLKDNKFDIVHSNATIEHVGNFNNQIKFVKEAIRISKKYIFLTTPNRNFFLDLHTAIPIIHWLPKKIHRLILKKIGINFLSKEENLNLLNSTDLKKICEIIKVKKYLIDDIKIFGFKSNLILIINKN